MISSNDLDYIQKFHDKHLESCPTCKSAFGIVCPAGENALKFETRKIEANIQKEYRGLTLDKMLGPDLKLVLKEVYDYVANYEYNLDNGIGLFLCSEQTGTGKSATAYGIAMEFLKLDKTAYCIGFDQCINLLSSRINLEEQRNFRAKVLTVDLLVLDDVGLSVSLSDKQKDFVRNEFTLLFKERSSNLKSTILTSNKSVDDLELLYAKQFKSVFMSRVKTIVFPEGDYRELTLNVGGY